MRISTMFRKIAHAVRGMSAPKIDAATAAAAQESMLGTRARILCIDDNPEFLRSLERQLVRDHVVVLAAGTEEGLQALREQGPFDVIICDLRMPGANGVTYVNRIREEAPEAERIILTGWADPLTLSVAASDGRAMRLLVKPCPTPVLREAITDALLRSRARRLLVSGGQGAVA